MAKTLLASIKLSMLLRVKKFSGQEDFKVLQKSKNLRDFALAIEKNRKLFQILLRVFFCLTSVYFKFKF